MKTQLRHYQDHLQTLAPYLSAQQKNVLERSCSALMILMQQVFVAVEREYSQKLQQALQQGEPELDALLRCAEDMAQLAEAKPPLEQLSVQAIMLAYAELACSAEAAEQDALQTWMVSLQTEIAGQINDTLDLYGLLQGADYTEDYTNRNRPLLIYLSGQLRSLFGIENTHLCVNPLSPATLIYAFVTALRCINLPLSLKARLFLSFESEFLSKLSSLLNNVINRLEQESLNVGAGIGFEEKHPGPVQMIYQSHVVRTPEQIRELIDRLRADLLGQSLPSVWQKFMDAAEEDSTDSVIVCVDEVHSLWRRLFAKTQTANGALQEWEFMQRCRQQSFELLNSAFAEKPMPVVMVSFIENIWQHVLYKACLVATTTSSAEVQLQNFCRLQSELLASVSPVQNLEQAGQLGQQVPALLRELRAALDFAGIRQSQAGEYLEQFKGLHLQNLQQKLSAQDFIVWQPLSVNQASLHELNAKAESAQALQQRVKALQQCLLGFETQHAA